VRDADYIKTLPVGVRHIGDNVAIPALDPQAIRMRRHILLAGCQDLVYPFWREAIQKDTGEIQKKSEFRVSVCCRQPVDDKVNIYKNDECIGYSGLMRCGNVWGCPICCAKVMRRRGEQIGKLFEAVHKDGGSAVMVTFTAAHQLNDKLSYLLDAFKDAKRMLTQSRPYRDLTAGRLGSVSATEITFGTANGWHPHQHDVWFYKDRTLDPEHLAEKLFPAWSAVCKKNGLTTQESFRGRRIGVDVRPSWDASEYLAKFDRERGWSLSSEMTAGRLKTAQGKSMTPWAILEDAIIRGIDSPASTLWVEYLRATKGKAVISLKGAKDLLAEHAMPTTLNDLADANKAGEGEVIATVTAANFDRVVRNGSLGRLLEAARSGGLAEVHQILQS
jgi:hypothetical protein